MIRGTPEKLMSQLVDEDVTVDPNFDEDFLLTHRTFLPSSHVSYWGKFLTMSMEFDKNFLK